MKNSYNYSSRTNPRRHNKKQNEWKEILLYYVLPFLVVNGIIFYLVVSKPKVTLTVADTNDYMSTSMELSINYLLPIKEMTVTLESETLELTKEGRRDYSAQITKNGVLDVKVTSFNGMTTTVYEHINSLDDTPPIISDQYTIEDNVLTISVEDSQSGINYNAVYAVDAEGNRITASSADKASGSISFPMDSDSLFVHAVDMAGNEIQAAFTENQ